jgi:hypothetical protein
VIALLSDGAAHDPVVAAFAEETSHLLVLDAAQPTPALVSLLRGTVDLDVILPTSAAVLAQSEELANALGLPSRALDYKAAPTQSPDDDGTTYSLELIRLGPVTNVLVAAFEHRVDRQLGRELLRHRLSLRSGSDEEQEVVRAGSDALDSVEGEGDKHLTEGPYYVQVRHSGTEWHTERVAAAPVAPLVPADAAFAATGVSFQHLIAEHALRRSESLRRGVRRATTEPIVAVAPVYRRPGDEQSPVRIPSLRFVRRLRAFHSWSPGSAFSDRDRGQAGLAAFVGSDRASVEFSLSVLHEMEDSGGLFDEALELISYSTDPPTPRWIPSEGGGVR